VSNGDTHLPVPDRKKVMQMQQAENLVKRLSFVEEHLFGSIKIPN
jgi:hypothetical protein